VRPRALVFFDPAPYLSHRMRSVTRFRDILIATFVLCWCAPGWGSGLLFEPRISLSSDAQIGARLGVHSLFVAANPIEAFFDVDARMVPYSVRDRVTPTFSYQFRERRWGVGGGISHSYQLATNEYDHTWNLVSGAGGGWSFADYNGTSRPPRTGWVGWGELGIRYDTGDSYWGAGLQVKPLPSVFPVRLTLQTGWKL